MLSKELIGKIIEFDRAARARGRYDRRRYGTVSCRELLGGAAVKPYWDARKGERMKDGAPTRKTLRYNVVVPERARGATASHPESREVMIYHVAVRLNRNYLPVVKDVAHFSPKTGVIEFSDIGYHQLGGWIVYWNRKDYDSKAWKALILPERINAWSKADYHWKGALTFPWHETVNPEDLKGTRYEYSQYEDGHGIGLCDYLALYRKEPKVEMLAKAGLYDLISPVACRALKDKRVFQWVKEHMTKLAKTRFSTRDALWAAKHGKELKDARKHYYIVNEISRRWKERIRLSWVTEQKIRLDYERIGKLLPKWKVKEADYARYLEEAERAGLDLRNEGTLYPPVKGGAAAFIARTERLEREADRRERAWRRAQRRRMREDAEKRRHEEKKRAERIKALMAVRADEIVRFQKSLERTRTLNGCGYRLILAKSQKELLAEGRRMHNCVGCGTYGEGIAAGDTLILTIAGGKERYCVEISRRSWKVRQCYGRHNKAAPDGIHALAEAAADALKAEAAKLKNRNRNKKRKAA